MSSAIEELLPFDYLNDNVFSVLGFNLEQSMEFHVIYNVYILALCVISCPFISMCGSRGGDKWSRPP